MCETTEVAIVGGGPTGLYLANLLAKKDISVTVIEQHKQIGKPVQCAGLITPRVFEQFHLPSEHIIQNSIKKANIHSPNDTILSIGGDRIHAYSINRIQFDKTLADHAEQYGAKIITGEKVQSIQDMKSHIEICTNKLRNIHSALIIGADGPKSIVRDVFGLPSPQLMLRGIGTTLTNTNLHASVVEIFVGNNIAPGFFAWIIPTNKKGTTARTGLCVPYTQSPKKYFDRFLNHTPVKPFLKNAKVDEYIAGLIPLGPLKQTVDDRVMLIGDAAAQVKPTSGGGIFTGLTCAEIASTHIISAIQSQNYSKHALSSYHKQWKKTIGRELSLGMRMHGLYEKVSDQQLNKYIKKFMKPVIKNTINKHGDIDFPSKLIKPMLKHTPSLIKFLPGLLQKKK